MMPRYNQLLHFLSILVVGLLPAIARPQARYPSVPDVIKRHDANKDGVLSRKEVAGSRYARQFPRWDADRNQRVSAKEIIAFRKRFGIAADGTLLKSRAAVLKLPRISELPRVDSKHRPSRPAARQSAFILNTKLHKIAGKGYLIITDHREAAYEESLQRLKQHHSASIVHVPDLAMLHKDVAATERLRSELRKSRPRYVAFAPRFDSFRENMILGMWEILTTIDEDPYVDALPGILLASDAKSFAKLVEQSIRFKPAGTIRPLAISQVQRASETRSLQKAGILRNYFNTAGLETPIVAIYGRNTQSAPRLKGKQVWNLSQPGSRQFVKRFPDTVTQVINKSTLIIMHGHGIPGMSCSVDLKGLPQDLTGKVLLTGSCFSAAPAKSDLAAMRQAPGGYEVKKRDAFVLRAIDHGAVVAFGHQRLSSGFPHLFPVLERLLHGGTVGEAYQRLINGLIELRGTRAGGFVVTGTAAERRNVPQNAFLYVLIGDPALRPIAGPPDGKAFGRK